MRRLINSLNSSISFFSFPLSQPEVMWRQSECKSGSTFTKPVWFVTDGTFLYPFYPLFKLHAKPIIWYFIWKTTLDFFIQYKNQKYFKDWNVKIGPFLSGKTVTCVHNSSSNYWRDSLVRWPPFCLYLLSKEPFFHFQTISEVSC